MWPKQKRDGAAILMHLETARGYSRIRAEGEARQEAVS